MLDDYQPIIDINIGGQKLKMLKRLLLEKLNYEKHRLCNFVACRNDNTRLVALAKAEKPSDVADAALPDADGVIE